MILWSTVALAGLVQCEEAPTRLGAGGDLLVHSEGLVSTWYGYGVDAHVSAPLAPCLRVGAREYVVHNAVTDPPYEPGFEWQLVTHATVGLEVGLPGNVRLGAHALPGVRATWVGQHTRMPARDLELDYHHVAFTPSLYAMGVLSWWPHERVGVRVDVPVPLLYRAREIDWFQNRLVGIGVDLTLAE